MSTTWAPVSCTIGLEISPVNAPLGSQWTFCAPIRMSPRRATAAAAGARETAGGKNHKLRPGAGAVTARNRSMNARAAAGA